LIDHPIHLLSHLPDVPVHLLDWFCCFGDHVIHLLNWSSHPPAVLIHLLSSSTCCPHPPAIPIHTIYIGQDASNKALEPPLHALCGHPIHPAVPVVSYGACRRHPFCWRPQAVYQLLAVGRGLQLGVLRLWRLHQDAGHQQGEALRYQRRCRLCCLTLILHFSFESSGPQQACQDAGHWQRPIAGSEWLMAGMPGCLSLAGLQVLHHLNSAAWCWCTSRAPELAHNRTEVPYTLPWESRLRITQMAAPRLQSRKLSTHVRAPPTRIQWA